MAYMTALDSSADPAKVRKDQRKWLSRLRQGRAGKPGIGQAYRERIAALRKYPKYTWKTYQDSVLGFSVEYPSNRIIEPGSDPGLFVLLVPGVEPEARTIEIKLIDQAFDSANAQEDIFLAKDGNWFAHGDRCSHEPKAEAIRGKGWKGLSAEFGCAGVGNCGGTCFEALFSDGSRSAYIFLPEPLSIYSRTLYSFRFLEPR